MISGSPISTHFATCAHICHPVRWVTEKMYRIMQQPNMNSNEISELSLTPGKPSSYSPNPASAIRGAADNGLRNLWKFWGIVRPQTEMIQPATAVRPAETLQHDDAHLTTLRQRPLKPSMIWIVDAMMKAPCVPRMVRKNFCTDSSDRNLVNFTRISHR
jgi:hypothetical protein